MIIQEWPIKVLNVSHLAFVFKGFQSSWAGGLSIPGRLSDSILTMQLSWMETVSDKCPADSRMHRRGVWHMCRSLKACHWNTLAVSALAFPFPEVSQGLLNLGINEV